jgi:TolB-like protein/Flp pilus assembly protein TadD
MESTDITRPLRFGAFELDVRLRELRTGERRIRLQEQPFEILRLMLERHGEIVTREQLRRRLWPDGTFVDFEHSLNAAVKRLRAALGDDADNPRFVETMPRRGYRFIAPLTRPVEPRPEPAAPASRRPRLAVLPFANLSREASEDYFSDGLTEEMIAQLGALCRGRVGVLARWSSMMFKGSTLRAREVGEALQAEYLLEGSVRRDGDRVRVTARLVEAASEVHLWSDTYDRDLVDCLGVQADVAARIARALAMELLPEPGGARPACDAAAYQAYLKGRYYWNKTLDCGLNEAIGFYEQALAVSPSFAPAHAALARARVARGEFYHEVPRLAFAGARASAARALELDPSVYEAFIADGDLKRMQDADWEGAEAAYLQAIAINPSNETAHRKYAALLSARGSHAEALRESDRACELDPLCLTVATTAAWVRYVSGDYAAAVDECRNTIDMDPEVVLARRLLGAALLQLGRTGEAIVELASAAALADGDPVLMAWLAHAQAVAGDPREARRLLVELRAIEAERYVSPYHVALVQTGLDDLDAAFDALDQAWLDRDGALGWVHVEPRFEPLRRDARYAALLERVGLG